MKIRPYQSDDLVSLTDLMVDLGHPTDQESLKPRMGNIQSNPMYGTFIAEMDGKAVGMIGVRQLYGYEHDHVVTQISALVTKSEYQGMGIGTSLVRYVEEWAKSKGSSFLVLTSGIKENRKKAHQFYESIGFEVTGYRFVKKINEGANNIES